MKQMSLQAVEYGCQYLESGLSVSSDSLAFHVFCFVQSNILSCLKPAAPKSTLPPRQELVQKVFFLDWRKNLGKIGMNWAIKLFQTSIK